METVVNKDVPTGTSAEEGDTSREQDVVSEGATPETPQAGDKTNPNLLLKSLQEEREKRKELETRIQQLEESNNPSVSSEPEDEIGTLKLELAEVKSKQQRSEVIESYPALKEIWSDFEEFRTESDNKGMNMRTAAKAFLTEKGLLEPKRKGLEKPTGGPRVPQLTGMTAEDVKNLRETNFKKYSEMLMKGQIKISS